MSLIRSWTYGSDPRCDFVLEPASPQHCLLAQYSEGYALEDLGSASGTWVNGARLELGRPQWVTGDDQIRIGDEPFRWPPSARVIRIGRAPENEVVLDYPMVSWTHARLTETPEGSLILEDLHSTNGTSLGAPGRRIDRAPVALTDDVYFGSLKIPVARLLSPGKIALGAAAKSTVAIEGGQMILGRDPACDYPIESPLVSWHHARLSKSSHGIEIEDLHSRNGTFVGGVRVHSRTKVAPGSVIALGALRLRLIDETGRLAPHDSRDNVTVEAAGVVVQVREQRLLDPVSLTILPGELVALMGLAGAGKTTLMKALNGYTRPHSGRVLFNGEDLYDNPELFRNQVGYVPQDDILHPQLTVREALTYNAQLRTDLRDDEIEARILTVLKDLGIEDIAGRLIGSPERKVISGGQRKRVNIAMELLSDPSVLFLDEPTSGLSSYDAVQVIALLRRLAGRGKTILCTIHQPSLEMFQQFDALIMVARDKGDHAGVLAYFGPAYPGSIEFFASPGDALSPERLMSGVASRPAAQWAERYRQASVYQDFVATRAGKASPAQASPSKPRRKWGVQQMATLFARNFRIKRRDRVQTLILLAQAPLFAILLAVVFHGLGDDRFTDAAKWSQFIGKVANTHFLLVVAGVWFGCNNAARDIVGETAIFLRERMVNLKLPSYVAAKLGTLALLCLIQCTMLLAIVYAVCGLSGRFLTLFGILFLSSVVGAALGLLISALSPTTEAAIAFLPVVLLPFILLGGGIKPVSDMPAPARWISAICPTRWAFEASILEEARQRKSEFHNELAEKLAECSNTPAGETLETDIAAAAFPPAEGRSSIGRSFEVLAISLAVCLILLLSVLGFKQPV